MDTYFRASSVQPELLPLDKEYGDLLEGIDDNAASTGVDADYARHPYRPDGTQWSETVAKYLGFTIMESLATCFDGSGCVILSRCEKSIFVPETHPARRFKFLSVLSISYEEDIIVAIRDEAALLQYYRLIESFLRLTTDNSFQDTTRGPSKGGWDQGRNWKAIADSRKAYFDAHPDQK
jgi:hypothetical protein